MNECIYENQKDCDWYEQNIHSPNKGEICKWITNGILDKAICQCPYHGIKKEVVESWKSSTLKNSENR